jgi:hypothetical protein
MIGSSTDAQEQSNSVVCSNGDCHNSYSALQLPITLRLPPWLHRRSSRSSSPTSSNSSTGMGARIAQLRNAFGLDDSEELYGQFSCAHTWPRWGAQFLQVCSARVAAAAGLHGTGTAAC